MTGGASPPGFTGGPLDRADALRRDPAALAAAARDPDARLLRLESWDPVAEEGRLGWTTLADAPAGAELLLLGFEDGRPHFAAFVPGALAPPPVRSPDLFAVLDSLRPGEAATFAAARSLIAWHARHRFCANCGAETAIIRAGWARVCRVCGAEHFPRVDPVVIMLAEHGGRVLLGREARWPRGRYSALAGFVEPGESIEEAVAREILEEAGVRVSDVRYVASQPWPFPGQLMIACTATAASDTITLDPGELQHAIWVTREEVRSALAGDHAPFLAPPPHAIAHTLLREWVGE